MVFENFEIVFWIRIPTFGGSVLWNFFIWGFLDDFIHSSGIIFLVPFLATKETLAPLANDPIMLGTSIPLFRHLKHQNLSTGDVFIYSSGNFLVPFLATKAVLVPLTNDDIMSERSIRLFRHIGYKNLYHFRFYRHS